MLFPSPVFVRRLLGAVVFLVLGSAVQSAAYTWRDVGIGGYVTGIVRFGWD